MKRIVQRYVYYVLYFFVFRMLRLTYFVFFFVFNNKIILWSYEEFFASYFFLTYATV